MYTYVHPFVYVGQPIQIIESFRNIGSTAYGCEFEFYYDPIPFLLDGTRNRTARKGWGSFISFELERCPKYMDPSTSR